MRPHTLTRSDALMYTPAFTLIDTFIYTLYRQLLVGPCGLGSRLFRDGGRRLEAQRLRREGEALRGHAPVRSRYDEEDRRVRLRLRRPGARHDARSAWAPAAARGRRRAADQSQEVGRGHLRRAGRRDGVLRGAWRLAWVCALSPSVRTPAGRNVFTCWPSIVPVCCFYAL